MFICPRCNCEVADPDYKPAPFWWRLQRGASGKPMPICRAGHNLRSYLLGNLTAESPIVAFLRGFAITALTLFVGMLEDLRIIRSNRPHLGLMMMAGFGLMAGAFAFWKAWLWAGKTRPVNHLASKACGFALGSLLPTVAAMHALYFHWANEVQMELMRSLNDIVSRINSA